MRNLHANTIHTEQTELATCKVTKTKSNQQVRYMLCKCR